MGTTVFVRGNYSENISSNPWGELTIGTLDQDMRPLEGLSMPVILNEGGECVFGIDASTGEARYRLFGTAHSGWLFFSGSYTTV